MMLTGLEKRSFKKMKNRIRHTECSSARGVFLWVNWSDFNVLQGAEVGMPPEPCDQERSVQS